MRIAITFYGQPRDYKQGFENLQNFISKQTDIHIDYFYHCWITENNTKYDSSPWAKVNNDNLFVKDNKIIMDDLLKLYNPKMYEYENTIDNFDLQNYTNTLAFKKMPKKKKNNINNILSQMYSRNKTCKMLEEYIKNTETNYDIVIMTRFDWYKKINLCLNEIDKSKIYVSNRFFSTKHPRRFLPDNFIVMPTNIYLILFKIYENLDKIIDNKEIDNLMKQNNECLEMNAEELIFAYYLYNYKNTENIVYTNKIAA